MTQRRLNLLVWFGILGGPAAWLSVHVIGIAFGWAQCNDPASRWQLPVHAWDVATAAVGVLVALAAEAVSFWVFRLTADEGEGLSRRGIGEGEAPVGRLHFLSVIGLTVNPLALAIIVMVGFGTALLPLCHQA